MITFIDYINENINKIDFTRTKNDNNFLIGCELEWINYKKFIKFKKDSSSKIYLRDIKESFTTLNLVTANYKNVFFNFIKQKVKDIDLKTYLWKFIDDPSLQPDNYDDFRLEIVMPPFSFNDICIIVPAVFDFIKKYGYTNDSCGFHVSISHKLLKHSDFSHEKMALMSDDEEVYKFMPSRKYNVNTIPSNKILKNIGKLNVNERGQSINNRYFSVDDKHNSRIEAIEYRLLGGKGYENQWNFIKKLIVEQMYYYKKSFEESEYINKKRLKLKYKNLYSSNINIKNAKDIYNIDFNNFVLGDHCINLINLLKKINNINDLEAKRYFYHKLFSSDLFIYVDSESDIDNIAKNVDVNYMNIFIDIYYKNKNLSKYDLKVVSIFCHNIILKQAFSIINMDYFHKLMVDILNSNCYLSCVILKYYFYNKDNFPDVMLHPVNYHTFIHNCK